MYAAIFHTLLEQYGPQEWWPAQSRFEIIVGALLVQRTAWRNAALAIANLKGVQALEAERIARLDLDRLEELVRPAGFFRTKAKRLRAVARFVEMSGGIEALDREPTETLRERLLAQQGIGPETADAILGYAFGRPVFVVDAYARRLFERLGLLDEHRCDDVLRRECAAAIPSARDLNELHALIVAHCQRCCLPQPSCGHCVLSARCAHAQSMQPDQLEASVG